MPANGEPTPGASGNEGQKATPKGPEPTRTGQWPPPNHFRAFRSPYEQGWMPRRFEISGKRAAASQEPATTGGEPKPTTLKEAADAAGIKIGTDLANPGSPEEALKKIKDVANQLPPDHFRAFRSPYELGWMPNRDEISETRAASSQSESAPETTPPADNEPESPSK